MPNSGWQQLFTVFEKTENSNSRLQFFETFTTQKERNALATRVEVAKALLAGKESQRDIAKRLNICIATVTRGSQNLKSLDKRDRNLLKSLMLDDSCA